jgi:hypothetical protein
MNGLAKCPSIATARIDLRAREINGSWGIVRRAWPIKGLATTSAILAGHALTNQATVNVTRGSLAVVASGRTTNVFPIDLSEDSAGYLHLAGVGNLLFPSKTRRNTIQAVIETLCSGHNTGRFGIRIFDSESQPVPLATWAVYYRDEKHLTLWQRLDVGAREEVRQNRFARSFLPFLHLPGKTIGDLTGEACRLTQRLVFSPVTAFTLGITSLSNVYYCAADTIAAAVEKNAPALAQQLDPVRVVNFFK